jgi:DNA-binding helix-hairpin-helix protein with protein kinase domain
MAVNPNTVTYEDNIEQVKLWRGTPVSLDSVVATGKNIHIYSTPGRHASTLMQMVKDAANRNKFELSVDTIFSDSETQNEIIRMKALNSNSRWTPNSIITNARQQMIEEYIHSIKNTPEWLEKVKQKAIQKNIPLDSMILLDAIYMVDSEK